MERVDDSVAISSGRESVRSRNTKEEQQQSQKGSVGGRRLRMKITEAAEVIKSSRQSSCGEG